MRKEGRGASTRMDGEMLECCSWTPQPQPLLSVPVPPASTSSIHLQWSKTPQHCLLSANRENRRPGGVLGHRMARGGPSAFHPHLSILEFRAFFC